VTVRGLHHLGLAVDDLTAAGGALRIRGFEGGPSFELASDDAARGNGLDAVRMRILFVSDGDRVVELIEHVDAPVIGCAPEPGRAGHQDWHLPGPREVAPAALPGIRVASESGSVSRVVLTATEPDATRRLLEVLGLAADGEHRTAPGLEVAVEEAALAGSAPPPRAHGRSHLALLVDDADAAHDRLVAHGYDCVSEPIVHDADIRWFFVRDPGGSGEIEIVEEGKRDAGAE
jgi:hypothetical protein